MSNAKDFLPYCVASTTGNPLLEQIRDQSSHVVLAIYRLVKNAMVHAIDNDAVRETAQQSTEILQAFGAEVALSPTLTFVDDSVFVCGQLLRATRKVYATAAELGTLLGRVGVSEVQFGAEVTQADLLAFAAAFVMALRDPEKQKSLLTVKLNNVELRKIDPIVLRPRQFDELPIHERILRLYATALVVMRQFHEDVAHGLTILPHRVKRLAQRLVSLSETGDPALLGTLAMANAHRDDAGRSVQTAMLSLAVGRQLTGDRISLSRLAMAALMADVGRARLRGSDSGQPGALLSPALEPGVASAAALVCIATGGINVANAERTVTVHETALVERDGRASQIAPLLKTQIVVHVRKLLELVAPRSTAHALPVLSALDAMASDAASDRTLVRMLVRVLGVLPTGTVVELESGEWAVVAGPSRYAEAWSQPNLRIVTDARGNALDPPVERDFGDPERRHEVPRVVRIIDAEKSRFNVTRALFTREAPPPAHG